MHDYRDDAHQAASLKAKSDLRPTIDDTYNECLVEEHANAYLKNETFKSGYVGAKTCAKSTIKFLYRQGMPGVDRKVAIQQAIDRGLNYGDHIMYMNTVRDDAERGRVMIIMAECGLSLQKLDTVRKQMLTRATKKLEKEAVQEQLKLRRKTAGITVKKADGSTKKLGLTSEKNDKTEGDRCVEEYDEWLRQKKAAARKGKRGFVVENLTPEEEAELIERHNNKGSHEIK